MNDDRTTRRLEAYARLIVRTGVNLRPGQELIVQARVEHAPLVRLVAEEAYRVGARYVDVAFADAGVRHALVEHGPDDALDWSPPWTVQRIERASEINAAAVGVSGGSDSALFADLDTGRLARARPLAYTRAWISGVLGGHLSWSLVAYPTSDWATEIFGEPDVERLWDAVAHALRLDEDDPAAAWQARADELERRCELLTDRNFDAIRYRGPGTDLEVGLIAGHIWKGGRDRTVTGQVHMANLPTEEVFTSPHRLRAEGTLRASVPFDLRGTIVEGLELRFAGGRIVDVRADHGADAVRADLATDEGASHLGEVALVDGTSRVGQTGVTFRNTLFDENARSHVAWGTGFGFALPDIPEAEHAERGLNASSTHIDFMIGRDELEIDGVEADGTVVPILRGGAWQLTG